MAFSRTHGYVLVAHDCFCVYLQLFMLRRNQKTSLGTGVLDGRAHKPVYKFFKNDLARNCLGDFDYCREIQLFDPCVDRASWIRPALVPPQPRIELIELPNFAVGSPIQIAGTGASQVSFGELVESACTVKGRRALVCESLVMNEAVFARRTNRFFV